MLENNVFRFIMFIGAVIVVALIINMVIANFEEIKGLVDEYFKFRLQKY